MRTTDIEQQLTELQAIIAQSSQSDGVQATPIPDLWFCRWTHPAMPIYGIYGPSLLLVAQGERRITIADQTYECKRAQYLITSVAVPAALETWEATAEAPCLCFLLKFDPHGLGDLMSETGLLPPPAIPVVRGIYADELSAPLLDAVLRLARLLGSSRDVSTTVSLIKRQILDQVLTRQSGVHLRQFGVKGGPAQRMLQAVNWLKQNYGPTSRLGDLAQTLNMNTASLQYHFAAISGMKPLKYREQLRLLEARRLILSEGVPVTLASKKVGYGSASHFSRDYYRSFGEAPLGVDQHQFKHFPE
ncbi:MAG TPA: AraC family transcriptional regulator [Bryobacteraceae bacterium]